MARTYSWEFSRAAVTHMMEAAGERPGMRLRSDDIWETDMICRAIFDNVDDLPEPITREALGESKFWRNEVGRTVREGPWEAAQLAIKCAAKAYAEV